MEENLFSKFAVPVLGTAAFIGLTGGYALLGALLPALGIGLGLVGAAALGLGIASAGGIAGAMTAFGRWIGALKGDSTADTPADIVRETGEMAEVVLPVTGVGTVAMGTGAVGTYVINRSTRKLLNEADQILDSVRDHPNRSLSDEDVTRLREIESKMGVTRGAARRIPRPFKNSLPNDPSYKRLVNYLSVLDKDAARAQAGAASSTPEAAADKNPAVDAVEANAKQTAEADAAKTNAEAEIKAKAQVDADAKTGYFEITQDEYGNMVERELGTDGKPINPATADEIIEATIVNDTDAPNSKTATGEVNTRQPTQTNTSLDTNTSAAQTSTLDNPNGSNPVDQNAPANKQPSPTVLERSGGTYDPVTGKRTPGPHTDGVDSSSSRVPQAADVTTAHAPASSAMDQPSSAHSPRGSRINAAGFMGVLGGSYTALNADNIYERIVGAATVGEGAFDTLSPTLSRFPQLGGPKINVWLPRIGTPVSFLNGAVSAKHTYQAYQSGDTAETMHGLGRVSIDSYYTASLASRLPIAQRIASNAKYATRVKYAGVGMRVAGRVAGPAALVLTTYDAVKLYDTILHGNSLEGYMHEVVENELKLQTSGVSGSYINKADEIMRAVIIADTPVNKPQFSDYKQLAKAMDLMHTYTGVSREELEIQSPEIIAAKLSQLVNAIKAEKTKALEKVPDGYLNIFKSNKNLAESAEGRMDIVTFNDSFVLSGGGSDEINKAVERVKNIDADLSAAQGGLYELTGDLGTGLLHDNDLLISYDTRIEHYNTSNELRAQLRKEMAQSDIGVLRDDVKKMQEYNKAFESNKSTMEKLELFMAAQESQDTKEDEKGALVAQMSSELYAKAAKEVDDDIMNYRALTTQREWLAIKGVILANIADGKVPEEIYAIGKKEMLRKNLVRMVEENEKRVDLSPVEVRNCASHQGRSNEALSQDFTDMRDYFMLNQERQSNAPTLPVAEATPADFASPATTAPLPAASNGKGRDSEPATPQA